MVYKYRSTCSKWCIKLQRHALHLGHPRRGAGVEALDLLPEQLRLLAAEPEVLVGVLQLLRD